MLSKNRRKKATLIHQVPAARIAKLWASLHLAAKWGQAYSVHSGWDTSKKNQGTEGNAADGTLPCMSNTPAGVSGSCVVGDVFFGWNIKTTNPRALVIKEPAVFSARAGVFSPLSWLQASRELLCATVCFPCNRASASCPEPLQLWAGKGTASWNGGKNSFYIVYFILILRYQIGKSTL